MATLLVPGQHSTIVAAMSASTNGDTVLVSDGTYTENLTYSGKLITVKSVNGAALTTISGTGSSVSTVRWYSTETSASVLDGFTITDGSQVDGGGIKITGANTKPTIKNCIITGNTSTTTAGRGGGLYIETAAPTFEDCTISNNTDVGTTYGGGGAFIKNCSGTFTRCTFKNNNAAGTGGGGGNGGAIYIFYQTPVFNDCTFESNTAIRSSAVNAYMTHAKFTNCKFLTNTTTSSHCVNIVANSGFEVNPVFTNCLWMNNTTGDESAAITNSADTGMLTLINCTITNNTGLYNTGIKAGTGCEITVTNCIVWNNIASISGSDISGDAASVYVTYSNVGTGYGSGGNGTGNIDTNPYFDTNGFTGNAVDTAMLTAADTSVLPATDHDGNKWTHKYAPALAPMGCFAYLHYTNLFYAYTTAKRVIRVPQDKATITQAVESEGVDGDLVIVAPGTYVETDIQPKQGVVSVSEAGPELTITDCNGVSYVWHLVNDQDRTTVINGFSIQGSTTNNGGLRCLLGHPTVRNCIIQGNNAAGYGGGGYFTNSRVLFENCIIRDNSTSSVGQGLYFREADAYTYHAEIKNTLFENNTLGQGTIYADGADLTITMTNCTIQDNVTGSGAGGVDGTGSATVNMINCISRNNGSATELQASLTTNVTYSNIQRASGVETGTGNINADPQYVDQANDDFRLKANSPGIDAGLATISSPDGTRSDMGSYYAGEGSFDKTKPATGGGLDSLPLKINYARIKFASVKGKGTFSSTNGTLIDLGENTVVETGESITEGTLGRHYHVNVVPLNPTSISTVGGIWVEYGDSTGSNPHRYFRVYNSGTNTTDSFTYSLRNIKFREIDSYAI